MDAFDRVAVIRDALRENGISVVFVHELSSSSCRWHFGDCFPNVEGCTIPTGADLENAAAVN